LNQSKSQQIIRTAPSIRPDEIAKQQVSLAQIASLQNSSKSLNSSEAILLQHRFLDSSGNEETQSLYEREYLKYKETEEEKKLKKNSTNSNSSSS